MRRLKDDLGRLGGLVKLALANGADRQTLIQNICRVCNADNTIRVNSSTPSTAGFS